MLIPGSYIYNMGVEHCCGYLIATTVFLISTIVLIWLQIAYRPYIATLYYKSAPCVVTKSIYSIQFACDCGKGCKSAYPCLLIYAKLDNNTLSEPEREWPVPVFDDDWLQVSVIENWDDDYVERVRLLHFYNFLSLVILC